MAWFRRPGLGMLLLCIWLIAWGVLALVPSLNFQAAPAVLAVLASSLVRSGTHAVAADDPHDALRPCTRGDLIGTWTPPGQ